MKKLILLTLITPILLAGCLLDYDDYVKIVFVTNDADETGNVTSQTHIVGSEATLPGMDDMIRYEYTFKGWRVTENGTEDYEEGKTIDIDSSFTTHAVNNVITLYAVWENMTDPSNGDKVFLWYNGKKLVANDTDGVPDDDGKSVTWHEAMNIHNNSSNNRFLPSVKYMTFMVKEAVFPIPDVDDDYYYYWTKDSYNADEAIVFESENGNIHRQFKSNEHSVRFYKIEDVL